MYQRLRDAVIPFVPEALYNGQLIYRRSAHWKAAKVIFIHIPKNGGTSINNALYGRFMGHYKFSDIEYWKPQLVKQFPCFAISRNPWDRLFSAYKFAKAGDNVDKSSSIVISPNVRSEISRYNTFEEFVLEWLPNRNLSKEDNVFKPQVDFIRPKRYTDLDPFIGKLENLSGTIDFLENLLGKKIDIGHENKTTNLGSYKDHFSTKMRELTTQAYYSDIIRFNYEF